MLKETCYPLLKCTPPDFGDMNSLFVMFLKILLLSHIFFAFNLENYRNPKSF